MEAAILARLADAKLSVQNLELELEVSRASLSGTSGISSHVTDATPHSSSKDVVNLMPGDLIWLKQEDETCKGTIVGDVCMRTVAMEQNQGDESAMSNYHFNDGILRICSRMSYRSKVEVSRIVKDMSSHSGKILRTEEELQLSQRRAANEAVENAELMERLKRGQSEGEEPVRYGDVVQLQQVNSELFLAMHKVPATQNPYCRKVSLKPGSHAAQFTILPRFKVHALGSVVHLNDRILLQSVKHENFFLGASEPAMATTFLAVSSPTNSAGSSTGSSGGGGGDGDAAPPPIVPSQLGPCKEDPKLHLRVPSVLRSEALCEVNGSMEPRCLRVKVFGNPRRNSSSRAHHHQASGLLAGLRKFRLLHPNSGSFVQASSNPDKGDVLDATGKNGDPLTRSRVGGVPAHVPYLKLLSSAADVANPANFSAKACWTFELADDRTRCGEVKWRETAVRLRHIPSRKLLSVDSINAAELVSAVLTNKMLMESGANDNEDEFGNKVTQAPPVIYDTCLVAGVDSTVSEGAFGSKSSLVFYLEPAEEDGSVDGVVRDAATSFRLIHKPFGSAETLHFISPNEKKPPFFPDTELRPPHQSKKAGGRICFSSRASPLDVLKIVPLAEHTAAQLHKLLAFIPVFKKWTFCFHAAAAANTTAATAERRSNNAMRPPLGLADVLVTACLDLMDVLCRGGSAPPRPHGGNLSELMKEASELSPAAFSSLFVMGYQDKLVQQTAQHIKLLDAVYEAVVAPYNYAREALNDGKLPFPTITGPVIKFLNLVVERCLVGNVDVQAYFASRSSRRWLPALPHQLQSDVNRVSPGGESISSKGEGQPQNMRVWTPLSSILIEHMGESLGANLALEPLLNSTGLIVQTLVSEDLLDRFIKLFQQFGPDIRFVSLFRAICYVERKPSRLNQELCLRKLWIDPIDRYRCSVTFHTVNKNDKVNYGNVFSSDGRSLDPKKRTRMNPKEAPDSFLGKTEENVYAPVCVAWSSLQSWAPNCGSLWWSASSLRVQVVEELQVEGMAAPLELVRIEELMWVLDPERLAKPITGSHWWPQDDAASATKFVSREERRQAAAATLKKKRQSANNMDTKAIVRRHRFERQKQLALHVVAQVNLFAQICRGRNYPAIRILEQHFSYDLLMNLSTNPLLPFDLSSAAMSLVEVLYLDRFPQSQISGARRLWILNGDDKLTKDEHRSSVPVIAHTTLESDSAFPRFSLPSSSSAHNDPNPVLSHPSHFKFALLSNHCNTVVMSFGESGVIHEEEGLNRLGMAAIRGSQTLLKFGFQSTYAKLLELCVPLGRLLDGRCDLAGTALAFDPPEDRYKDDGHVSAAVTKLRKEVVDLFFGITDLRSDYRLGQILNIFKTKLKDWESKNDEVSASARSFLRQKTPEDVEQMFAIFEDMFPGGKGDGARLDLAALSSHPKIDEALCDCLMYENDDLMAAALRLLHSTYGQRLHLRKVLKQVVLLEKPQLPIYGDVHSLRVDVNELVFLQRTSFVWGIKSLLSGPFGDNELRQFMEIIDRLITFLSTTSAEPKFSSPGDREKQLQKQMHRERSASVLKPTWINASGSRASVVSIDIASKWESTLRACEFEAEHQGILASLDIQAVLLEVASIDARIGGQNNSQASPEDIEESFRRLNLAKQALLCLSIAFCSNHHENQARMFPCLKELEEVAGGGSGGGHDGGSLKEEAEVGVDVTAQLAQNLIMAILRGNQHLCEKVPISVIELFSTIMIGHADISTSPALELFFIVAQPESLAVKSSQDMIVNHIVASSHASTVVGTQSLSQALSSCISTEAAIAEASSASLDEEEDDVPTAFDDMDGTFELAPATTPNNCRLLRLLRTILDGGNEAAATLLKLSIGLTIDNVCNCVVAFLDNSGPGVGTGEKTKKKGELTPSMVLDLLSKPDSFGSCVLVLLVELLFLLPISSTQIMSLSLWNFMEKAVVPAMEALANHTEHVPKVIVDLMDLVDRVFTYLVRLGFYHRAAEDSVKGAILSDIVEDTVTMASKLRPEEGHGRCIVCAERVVKMHRGNGADVGALQVNRLDEYKDWMKTHRASTVGKGSMRRFSSEMFANTNGRGSTFIFGNKEDYDFDRAPTKEKFRIYCEGLLNNRFILSSIQRRRFLLVSVLEAGLKGPPEDIGRNLFVAEKSDVGPSCHQSNHKKKTKAVKRKSQVLPEDNATFAAQDLKSDELQEAVGKIQAAFRRFQVRAKGPGKVYKSNGEKINRLRSAVEVSWTQITSRFVRYVRRHFWQPGYGRDTSVLIFDTWCAHLLKARTWGLDEEGNKVSVSDLAKLRGSTLKLCTPFELNDYELKEYQRRQVGLSKQGVSALLAEVICGLEADLSHGGLPTFCINLLNELLLGGNTAVQKDLYHHLFQEDSEGKLAQHLEKRLEESFENLVEAKKTGSIGSNQKDQAAVIYHDCSNIIMTARFMQLLCEGHQSIFQNYLRSQPMCTREVDLVKKIETILTFLCESSFLVSRFTSIEVDLVSQLLATLIELTQGPCEGNQEHVAGGDVVMALNFIIPSTIASEDEQVSKDDPDYKDLRGLSCVLLAACLEGNKEGSSVHAKLARRLEVEPLAAFKFDLESEIKDIVTAVSGQSRLPNDYESKRLSVLQQEHVAVVTVLTELFSEGMDLKKAVKAKNDLVGFIEISWSGEIEGTFFPLPFEIRYLSSDTKAAFLEEVDLSTTEKRMKTLIKSSETYIAQMSLIYNKAEQERAFKFVHTNFDRIRLIVYFIALLLNLAILFSPPVDLLDDGTSSTRRRSRRLKKSKGSSSVAATGSAAERLDMVPPFWALVWDLDGSETLDQAKRINVVFTLVCAALVLVGYGAITHNMGVTELPLVIEEVDNAYAERDSGGGSGGGGEEGGGGGGTTMMAGAVGGGGEIGSIVKGNPWRSLLLGIGVMGFLSVFHAFTYVGLSWPFYIGLCVLVNIPIAAMAFRSHVEHSAPATSLNRKFAITYDVFFKRSFLRNHVLLATLCLLGCFNDDEFFTLQLLDVVSVSPVISDIIKSVTSPGFSLALVFYLFCVTVIIWARFGMTHFAEYMEVPTRDVETGETGTEQCRAMLGCFLFIFYQGLAEAGNILTVLSKVSPGTHVYQSRIVYDSIFVVWVSIVLLNIITGLMVDTFSAIREEKATRQQTLDSECFVCGIHRDAYEDIATSDLVPSFDVHMSEDHNLWTYVHYLAYLKHKDPTEDNGIESYVRQQVVEGLLDWIPSRTCIALQQQKRLEEQHEQSLKMRQEQEDQSQQGLFSVSSLLGVGQLGAGLAGGLAGFAAGGLIGGGKAGMAGVGAGISGVAGGVSSLLGMARTPHVGTFGLRGLLKKKS